MFDTQSYKKATIPPFCCTQNCNQGRKCPRAASAEYSLVNIIIMLAGAGFIGGPFIAWAWSL